LPPVDGFCAGGRAVGEAGGELGVGAAAAGEAERPQCCGGPVVVVDGLIHGIGIGLAGAVAAGRCPDVAEQSGELRVVVAADPFTGGAPFGFGAQMRRYRAAARPAAGLGSPAVPCGKPGGSAGAAHHH